MKKEKSNRWQKASVKENQTMKFILLRVFFVLFLASYGIAQQPVSDKSKMLIDKNAVKNQSKERRGTIKGRVVNDSGQPITNVSVNLFSIGAAQGQRRNVGVDESGRFEVDDLSPVTYSVTPYAPGYIMPGNPNERRYYRIGDDVTLTLQKGGVITGMVRTPAGEPVIGVMVSVLRVRDAQGKPSTRGPIGTRDRATDDRGIYRIYGLEPGAYVISAGGRSNFSPTGMNKYAEDMRTYHPSSTTRETAAEIMVQNGQEVSGIDINYRGEKGYVVSGTISGVNSEISNASISVILVQATTGLMETYTTVPLREGKQGFALYGVSDGDYLIRAELYAGNTGKNHFFAPPRRVNVKGNNVSGLELALAPMGSISGVLVLEKARVVNSGLQCEKQREATIEEALISFRKDTKGESLEQKWLNASSLQAPNEKGEFAAYRLFPGSYRLVVNLSSETWYIKSAALSAASKSNQPNYKGGQLSDVAAKGIAVKSGEQVATLTVTIAEGAASLSGAVKTVSEREALPPGLRVYLIPSERENANDVLRFFQSEVQFDGAFSFSNIPPGKYWVLSRVGQEESLSDNTPRPVYWDLEGRVSLVKEAVAANSMLDLQPCRKITDYSLRHGLPQATVTSVIKK
jgi:hypothetical protein